MGKAGIRLYSFDFWNLEFLIRKNRYMPCKRYFRLGFIRVRNTNLLLIGVFGFLFAPAIRAKDSPVSVSQNPGAHSYSQIKSSIARAQRNFKQRYNNCNSNPCRENIVNKARHYIFSVLTDKIFPAWYGTKWSFNGTSRVPGQERIACGSFVVFTLQDAGFKIATRMYRQPAENIIKNLASPDNIRRFPNRAPMEKIIRWIRSKGEGLYIVGLDIHVGFIIFKNNRITFCHSSYYDPPLSVVNQDLTERSPLKDSSYRVIGKILDDRAVEKWINGEAFSLIYDYFGHKKLNK